MGQTSKAPSLRMAGVALLGLSIAALASAAEVAGENWADEKSELTSSPEYAGSKAICRRVGDPSPPVADRPDPAQMRALKGCDSERLYYGDGSRPDYLKARWCAMIEADGADEEVFGGSTILMQIYANGLGVKRNPGLATAYACQIGGAPAEINGRVLHMQALRTRPGHVDYCDDITSGLAEGYCQSRASSQAAVGRDARLNALVATLPPLARTAWAPMKQAFDTFVDAHVSGEVDRSGTARAAEEIQEEDAVRDQFVKDLTRLLTGHWPPGSSADAAAADAALNVSYRHALDSAAGKANFTTIKAEDIRIAQRGWLVFRDAFNRFAVVAVPSVNGHAVTSRMTRLRTAQLDGLSG